jgi:two-component system cell cycle sensor histidine kinase/response regulator CckA
VRFTAETLTDRVAPADFDTFKVHFVSGKAAIALLTANHKKIDLVILDLIMPEMGGGETFDALRGIEPRMKILLSSGYALEGEAEDILERGCNGFIQKPFSLNDLSEKIRVILDVSG